MADPSSAATFQQAHTLTWLELLVGFLDDGNQAATIQFYGDFNAILACNAFFRCRSGDTTDHRANHRRNDRAFSMAYRTTGNAAYYCPSCRTNATLGTFQLDRAYAFHDAGFYRLYPARFVTAVGAAGVGTGARNQNQAKANQSNQSEYAHHHSLSINLI